MKLTDEQIDKLSERFYDCAGLRRPMQYVASELIAMIAASDTHRIVEAPKGYTFTKNWQTRLINRNSSVCTWNFALTPIPAPCPPPKLEPVQITVENVYGKMPEIPEAYKDWQVEFGEACKLLDQGFTHCLYLGLPDSVETLDRVESGIYRICLRKWEGK